MEQITQYFEQMDYVSFGVIALPCVIIAVYGFLQVASGLAKSKNDKMQRCNNNNNNNHNNNGNSGSNNSKRCTQKYANGNIATTANATATTAATATIANSYQQNNNSNNSNNSNNKSNATRKARYNHSNNNNSNNMKRQDGNATAAYNMQQKRSNVAGSDATWHRFVTSSCIEEKFLSHHNPGHRNSTSSEATSEDIHSSDEHPNKAKNRSINGHGGNNTAGGNSSSNKSRSKRQQKSQSVKQTGNRTQLPMAVQGQGQVQPLEVQPAIKVNNSSSSSSSKCKQGKWRNSNNISSGSNSNSSNQKRSSSNNNKSKQSKCNSKASGNSNNSSSSNNINNNSSISSSSSNNGKSIDSYCGSNSSNSSSALSSPGSSPNSGSNSSSGNSSCNSNSSISGICNSSNIFISGCGSHNITGNSWQHSKVYRQNVNFLVPPLRQYERLDLDDVTLQQQLQRYLIEPHLLRVYGFPVESVVHEGAIEIFKCLPHMNFAAAHVMAVTETALTVINCHDGLNTSNFEYSQQCQEEEEEEEGGDADGEGEGTINEIGSEELEASPASTSTDSGNISPRSLDSESGGEWSGSECESSPSGLELYCNYAHMERSLAKQCVRCKHDFLVDELSGQYLTREECSYHWGKYHRCYDGNAWVSRWTCCNASDECDSGCTRHELHVWTGSVVGVNGPYRDFVHTRPRSRSSSQTGNRHNRGPQTAAVYALDCEMSYTGRGLDVTKVSLVALNGQLVYEHYVRPDADIVDYNTRYSGVTAKDLKSSGVKTLAEVQRDLLELIDADTILIGHGLDNDLRALRLVHNTLIDTSIAFPHSSGFPYRRALRHLTKTHLNREIQSGDGATGHSSFEDSRACMELMLWRVRCELDSDGSWED
ncbi:CAR1 transcription factor [Drosophila innubila]|uniref:CAR1 transcription factor n=1 Tax=Drosophila innubila TaxID=198719 RepID=UPI00148E4FEB|nr:CAR1 transcription factor [Drosophila innubila]